jgi:transcriptional regulator with XRE-family HTH domain
MTPEAKQVTVTLGSNLRRLRRAAGLSNLELASRAGVSQATISHIQTGARGTLAETAATIAGVLGVSVRYLLTEPDCAQCHDMPPAGYQCRLCRKAA